MNPPGVHPSDYAFTVEAQGTPWDVYRLWKDGVRGMVAFRKVGEQFEVGFIRVGEFTADEVAEALRQSVS